MAPVTVHTSSPITAAKSRDATSDEGQSGNAYIPPQPRLNAAAASTSQGTSHGYPAAAPGASPPMPAPTGAVQQRYDIQPTPTSTQPLQDNPPPAQPGAVPVPPTGTAHSIPPPPKAGETLRPEHLQAATQAASMPPQMSYAPPTASATQRSSTSTVPAPQSSFPVPSPLAGPPADLGHPPGYQQDIHASEFTSNQRAAHNAAVGEQGGIFSGSGGRSGSEEGIWDAAKKWANAAGESIAAAESEVWKRINKD